MYLKNTRIVVRSRKGLSPACWAVRLGTNIQRITEILFDGRKDHEMYMVNLEVLLRRVVRKWKMVKSGSS